MKSGPSRLDAHPDPPSGNRRRSDPRGCERAGEASEARSAEQIAELIHEALSDRRHFFAALRCELLDPLTLPVRQRGRDLDSDLDALIAAPDAGAFVHALALDPKDGTGLGPRGSA